MGRKLALLIASSTYNDTNYSSLNTPKADIDALAGVLARADIGAFDDVRLLVDEPVTIIKLQIEQFFNKKDPDDLLLLYFSGHGDLTKRGALYLIGKDTQRDLLMSTAISSAFIREVMDSSRSRRQVFILDCCYSGAFARGSKGDPDSEDMAALFEGHGRFVLTAAGATQLAWEGEETPAKKRLSVFTNYLVEGLETGNADLDGDGRIIVDELYRYTYEHVLRDGSQQTPGKWTENQQGSIVLAKNPQIARPTALSSRGLTAGEISAEKSVFQIHYGRLNTRAEITTNDQIVSIGVSIGTITTDMLDILKEVLSDIKRIALKHSDREFLMLRGAWFDGKMDIITLYIDLIHDYSVRPTLSTQQIRGEFYDGNSYYGSRKMKIIPWISGTWVHSSTFQIMSEEYYKRLPWREVPSLL